MRPYARFPAFLLALPLAACAPTKSGDSTLQDDVAADSDSGTCPVVTRYLDVDGDGYGGAPVDVACADSGLDSAALVDNADDCDDGDAAVNPGAVEICNGIDDNCVDGIDEGVVVEWFRDADGDGHGAAADVTTGCVAPDGYVGSADDCDDADADTHPGATEVEGDGSDQDCDGSDLCGSAPCDGLGTEANPAESCEDLYERTGALTGAYWVDPDGTGEIVPFDVWCDMKADGGGWTLVLKTDASSTAHYTPSAVSPDELDNDALDAVAKLDDTVIQAIQATASAIGDVRVDASGTSDTLIEHGLTWSMADDGAINRTLTARTGSEASSVTGVVCYDGDASTNPPCSYDHWCFGKEGAEHACIRRWGTAGIWMNWGIYPSGYYPATVWVR